MRVIPPIVITDAILTSSTVVEVAPAAYVAGTTYGLAATSSVAGAAGLITVYQALQAGNVGHAPATSPTWWQNIGTTYGVYSASTTYALGDRVIDPAAHLVYESQVAGNVGQPLATGAGWLVIGPTNKWAPFDRLRNTQAITPVDQVYVMQPGMRADSIAVIGLDASTVKIDVSVAGVSVYSVTTKLSTRRTLSWRTYFFGQFTTRKSVQYFNLPPYRNATITVTVSKTSGSRACGGIIIGSAIYLGDTQYSPTSDHLNFSVVDRDAFGNINLQARRSVPTVNETVWFDKSLTSTILAVRETLNGVPAVWSGLDDFNEDYFEPLFIYGIHKEFSLNLAQYDHGIITLQVEEL